MYFAIISSTTLPQLANLQEICKYLESKLFAQVWF